LQNIRFRLGQLGLLKALPLFPPFTFVQFHHYVDWTFISLGDVRGANQKTIFISNDLIVSISFIHVLHFLFLNLRDYLNNLYLMASHLGWEVFPFTIPGFCNLFICLIVSLATLKILAPLKFPNLVFASICAFLWTSQT